MKHDSVAGKMTAAPKDDKWLVNDVYDGCVVFDWDEEPPRDDAVWIPFPWPPKKTDKKVDIRWIYLGR